MLPFVIINSFFALFSPHLLWVWISFFTFCGFGYHSSPFVGLDIILHLLWVWISFFTLCGFGYHSSPCVGLVIILHIVWVWLSFFTLCGFGYHSSPFVGLDIILHLVWVWISFFSVFKPCSDRRSSPEGEIYSPCQWCSHPYSFEDLLQFHVFWPSYPSDRP